MMDMTSAKETSGLMWSRYKEHSSSSVLPSFRERGSLCFRGRSVWNFGIVLWAWNMETGLDGLGEDCSVESWKYLLGRNFRLGSSVCFFVQRCMRAHKL
jgi:hypothetical protein